MDRDEGQYQLNHMYNDRLKNHLAIYEAVKKECTQKIVIPLLVLIMMTECRRNVHTVSAILD